MVSLEDKIKEEKNILNKMIENRNANLSCDLILEQSRKVDKLIVAYQRINIQCIKSSNDKFMARIVMSNV